MDAKLAVAKERLGNKLYQRLGWQPRCKPTILPSGRILLPLYTDTFSISIMAISDDDGATWYASKPLIGFGNIQPAVLRRNDGTLVAYMRENGPLNKIRVAESSDDGIDLGTGWGQRIAESRFGAGRSAAGQRPLAADLQRHDQRAEQSGRVALRRRREDLEMDAAPGAPCGRFLSLSGRDPRSGRHDPCRLQLLRERGQEHEARRVQRSVGPDAMKDEPAGVDEEWALSFPGAGPVLYPHLFPTHDPV